MFAVTQQSVVAELAHWPAHGEALMAGVRPKDNKPPLDVLMGGQFDEIAGGGSELNSAASIALTASVEVGGPHKADRA